MLTYAANSFRLKSRKQTNDGNCASKKLFLSPRAQKRMKRLNIKLNTEDHDDETETMQYSILNPHQHSGRVKNYTDYRESGPPLPLGVEKLEVAESKFGNEDESNIRDSSENAILMPGQHQPFLPEYTLQSKQ